MGLTIYSGQLHLNKLINKIAEQIIEQEGDYTLAPKDNQGNLSFALKIACIGYLMSLLGKINHGFDKAMPMKIWPFYASTRLYLLHLERSSRAGMHAKRLKVGWNNDYLQCILDGIF